MFHAKRNGNLLLLVVYVDDLLIASSDNNWIGEVKLKLTESFDLKDLGMAKYCLGLEITQENDCVTVNQRGYINDILNRYGMSHCNPVMTPAELKPNRPQNSTEKLQDVSCVNDTKENWTYRELIGSLMYLVVGTRSDIANTVSRLAQFVNDPQRQDMVAAKRVLKYLAGSKTLGIKYVKSDKKILCYSDADWGGCNIDRRSYTGYVFLFGDGPIIWKSQKQRSVALSSTEAEYVALSEATKEILYLKGLLEELGLDALTETTLCVHNRGAICLASDPVFHSRTKHIDIRYHFVRDVVRNGSVVLKQIPTNQMTPLVRVTHWRCVNELGCTTKEN